MTHPQVIRIYDATRRRWVPSQPNTWTGMAWAQGGAPDPGVWFGSVFDPYLATGTVFTRDVAAMPLHPKSADIARYMPVVGVETTQRLQPFKDDPSLTGPGKRPLHWDNGTSLNTIAFNIPIYTVDSTMPGCRFAPMVCGSVSAAGDVYLNGLIPVPPWAERSGGGDKAFALYDKGTGIMREYYGCAKDGAGAWSAARGGYYLAERELPGLPSRNYAMRLTEGGSAVVGMLSPLLQIGIAEARAGQINHAVGFTMADGLKLSTPSWPAAGSDGQIDPAINPDLAQSGYWPPAEGQWFRLPPDLDLDATHLGPLTRVIAKAVQKYGGMATDKNWHNHAFNAEPGTVEKHWTGRDPWSNDLQTTYDTLYRHDKTVLNRPLTTTSGLDITDFPWHLTQWAPLGWGLQGGS